MSRPHIPVGDVRHLPTHAFHNRDIMWWGTLAFICIEGFTLVLAATAWLYLRKNFATWPPEGTRLPDVVVPTVQVAVMLASLLLVRVLDRAAQRHALVRVRNLLTAAALVSAAVNGLRVWELVRSLNVRWDANAYGSAQWLVVGAHGTLLLVQFVEVLGMAAIFWRGPVENKHFSDAADVAGYWIFIVLVWVPLYLLCFWGPRWI
jgi:cytochrome c oxidase subunit 3